MRAERASALYSDIRNELLASCPRDSRAKKPGEPGFELFRIAHLAFPDSQHRISHSPKPAAGSLIAPPIALQLRQPLLPPRRRHAATPAAVHVPEAAGDEDHLLQPREHQVRRAGQVANVQAITVTHRVDEPPNGEFRRRVRRSDQRHDARAFGPGEGVGHGIDSICTEFGYAARSRENQCGREILQQWETNMTKRQLRALKKHFREWSGGGPPESQYAIRVYMDYAVSMHLDKDEAEDALWEWMESDDPDDDLPPHERPDSPGFFSLENVSKAQKRYRAKEQRRRRKEQQRLAEQGGASPPTPSDGNI